MVGCYAPWRSLFVALLMTSACGSSETKAKPKPVLEVVNNSTICTLNPDGTCTSSDPDTLCCPQQGQPLDFEKRCWSQQTETLYCAEDHSGVPLCGSAPSNGCGATSDGSQAWNMVPGLWQQMSATNLVTCEAAGLDLEPLSDIPHCTD